MDCQKSFSFGREFYLLEISYLICGKEMLGDLRTGINYNIKNLNNIFS